MELKINTARKILRLILGFVWQMYALSGLVALAILYMMDQQSCIEPGWTRSISVMIGFTSVLAWKCFAFATKMALRTGKKPEGNHEKRGQDSADRHS